MDSSRDRHGDGYSAAGKSVGPWTMSRATNPHTAGGMYASFDAWSNNSDPCMYVPTRADACHEELKRYLSVCRDSATHLPQVPNGSKAKPYFSCV
jgi:hypothetical protein